MSIAMHAVTGARLVRQVTLGLAAAVLVCLVALQAFQAQYGQPAGGVVSRAEAEAESPWLSAAIQQQGAEGRRCSEVPALTDTVLFQASGTERVTVVTFDQALAASSAGTGWIRGYCL